MTCGLVGRTLRVMAHAGLLVCLAAATLTAT